MFKDRELRVRLAPKDSTPDSVDESTQLTVSEQVLDKIDEVTKDVLREGASLLLIYIAADTVRKVIIELAKK